MRTCPKCRYDKFTVFYTDPPIYKCKHCGEEHTDPKEGPHMRVLSREEGMKKRPEMYGLPKPEK